MFRKVVKKIQEITVKPGVLWYIKQNREFIYKDLNINVLSGVFHPLLFHSTKILAGYAETLNLNNKSFAEAGSGSGLLSIIAAKKGAIVSAFDLNPLAVRNTSENAQKNNLSINTFHSDLFTKISPVIFDFIFINPPFYPSDASDEKELAWKCGNNHEYFIKLFKQLPSYYNSYSNVVMILSEDCNLEMIKKIASQNNQYLQLLFTRYKMLEKFYVFKILSK